MKKKFDHFKVIRQGLVYHEAFRYTKAMPYFRRVLKHHPDCPCAIYNVANTLHNLGEDDEACVYLRRLIEATEGALIDGCPESETDPLEFQVDALFLMFLSSLESDVPWQDAYPFAEEHLARRDDDLQSVFSRTYVTDEIERLRKEHS